MKSILCVDDDERILSALARTQRSRRLWTAANSNDALAIAAREPLDLAVVDLRLGGQSGIDLVRGLVGLQPDLVVVLVSALLSVGAAVAAVKAGAYDAVVKPFKLDELIAELERPGSTPSRVREVPTLKRIAFEGANAALKACHNNRSEAARRLKIDRKTLNAILNNPPD